MTVTGAILSLPEVAEMTRLVSLKKKDLLKLFSLRIYALISPPRNYRPLHYVELLTVGFPFLGLSFHGLFSLNLSLWKQSKERPFAVCYCLNNNNRLAAV